MAHLYRDVSVKSLYKDRKFGGGQREWQPGHGKRSTEPNWSVALRLQP